MRHLRNLLNTVSSEEESMKKDNEFSHNEEQEDEGYHKDHDSSTKSSLILKAMFRLFGSLVV